MVFGIDVSPPTELTCKDDHHGLLVHHSEKGSICKEIKLINLYYSFNKLTCHRHVLNHFTCCCHCEQTWLGEGEGVRENVEGEVRKDAGH